MSLYFADLVKETTDTVGTGTVTLNGAAASHFAIPDAADGLAIGYKLVSGDGGIEIGRGTFTLAGRLLSRDTVEKSTAGGTTKITLTGVTEVTLGVPASWYADIDDNPADKSYTHTQGVPSASWSVAHGLGKFPSVSVVDSAGDQVYGTVGYVDANNLTIDFAAGFSGKAYLN